jgi:hypothetical protein
MSGWVSVNVLAVRDANAADGDNSHLRGVGVLDHHVYVELLPARQVWPRRRSVIGCKLESEAGRVVVLRDDDPVIGLIGNEQSVKFGIEPGEHTGLRAVDHDVVARPIMPILPTASFLRSSGLVELQFATSPAETLKRPNRAPQTGGPGHP